MSQLTIPVLHSPSAVIAAHRVGMLLEGLGYSQHYRERVVKYVIRNGTVAGCVHVEAVDEPECERVIEESFEPIPYDSEAWGELPSQAVPSRTTDPHPAVEFRLTDGRVVVRESDGSIAMMPLSGGSPEDEPFQPSPEDWREFCEWSRSLEERGDWPREKSAQDRQQDLADVRAWYREHVGR